MAKCDTCSVSIVTVESLMEEACDLETKLEEATKVINAVVSALKIVGMLRRIDYHTLKQSQVSIMDWHDKNFKVNK